MRPLAAQVGFAFRRIEDALNFLVDKLPRFSGLAAEAERLDALFLILHDRNPPMEEQIARVEDLKSGLLLQELTVHAPASAQILCRVGAQLTSFALGCSCCLPGLLLKTCGKATLA